MEDIITNIWNAIADWMIRHGLAKEVEVYETFDA